LEHIEIEPNNVKDGSGWQELASNSADSAYIVQSKYPFGENTLKKLTCIIALFVLCSFGALAHGQQFDAAVGLSTLSAPSATTSNGLLFPSLTGGAYPDFSADFLLKHHLGVEGEISWRAAQSNYGGNQPFRPIFYAFNAIWAPRISKNLTAEVLAGVGGEDLRFYGIVNCNYVVGCTNYTSSNHFMGDFGGGIRAYVWHNMFIRPEARIYLVNNNQEFSSGRSARYGISLGYSFGGR
jgi:hypothetical protein